MSSGSIDWKDVIKKEKRLLEDMETELKSLQEKIRELEEVET